MATDIYFNGSAYPGRTGGNRYGTYFFNVKPPTIWSGPVVPPSNLLVWLVADNIQGNSGDAVGTWFDSSIYSNNFVQNNSVNYATLMTGTVNGHNALHFNGINNILYSIGNSGSLTYRSHRTIFIVAFSNSFYDNVWLLSTTLKASNDYGFGISAHYGTSAYFLRQIAFKTSVNTDYISTPEPALGQTFLIGCRYMGTGMVVSLNGTMIGTTNFSSTIKSSATSCGSYILGGDQYLGTFGKFSEFAYSEIRVYGSLLDQTTYSSIETELIGSYGITPVT